MRTEKENISGQKYNKLSILNKIPSKKGRTYYNCLCDCGTTKIIRAKEIKNNNVKSCGCLKDSELRYKNKSLIGLKYGKLTVTKEEIINEEKICECLCLCGNIKSGIKAYNLKNGNTKTCGCGRHMDMGMVKYQSDNIKNIVFRPILSRVASTARQKEFEFDLDLEYLFSVWKQQNGICPYSGINMTISSWNEGVKSSHTNASIDRIDSNKGYIKGNIQFVTAIANYAKNTFSDKQMIEFCKSLAYYWNCKKTAEDYSI